ncbi:MAG: NERD domain-containing protein [Rikenellaceae bacterium]|jgi:hypothetical protein|nr:NERD domain-containing protein [Rikenellaceae bacterium]
MSDSIIMTALAIIGLGIVSIVLIICRCVRQHKINEQIRINEYKQNQELIRTVTDFDRGTGAERDLILGLLKYGISSQAIFHDLYVRKHNGKFSQIDLVVATKVSIIVFEVKDYSGWIFGNGKNTQWTQVLAYGRNKYRFYNPIMQNASHMAELQKRLSQCAPVPFYSVIVFCGDCELREISFVPEGTFIVKQNRVLEVVDAIVRNNYPANYSDKNEVVRILKASVQNGNNEQTRIRHVENIKDMLGTDRVFR